MTSIGKHIDKVGIFGSLFAALCCLGVPAVVTAASAIGLGFVINDATLMPIMGVSLAIILIGLGFGFRHHHKPWPLVLAVLGGALLVTMIDRHEYVLERGYEPEVGRTLQPLLEAEGIEMITSAAVLRVRKIDGGQVGVTVKINGREKELRAEKLLVAVGRRPTAHDAGG